MATSKPGAPSAATPDGTSSTPVSASSSTATGSRGNAGIATGPEATGHKDGIGPLTERLASLLEERGIDSELALKIGIGACVKRRGDWIAIPFFVNGALVKHKYRTIGAEKEFFQDAGAPKALWNVDCLLDDSLAGQALVITEGELDAVAALQAGFPRTVAFADGAPSAPEKPDTTRYDALTNAARLADATVIILAVDNDATGAALLHDLSIRLGRHRCKWVQYPLHPDDPDRRLKDLNDVLKHYGARGVVKTLTQAQWIRMPGVYRMDELPPINEPESKIIGMPGLAKHYKMRLGDLCVVCGIPGHGKTSFINDVCFSMAQRFGWTTCFASFEQQPQTDHKRNLRTLHAGKWVKFQTADETARADRFIAENFSFIYPDDEDDITLDWLLDRVKASVIQHGAKIVVIDPWNEMDHVRPDGMTPTDYVQGAIKTLRRFAKRYRVHLMLAAHPAKMHRGKDGTIPVPSPYDIADSAHFYNKPEVTVVVHRTELKSTKTLLRFDKGKYHATIGVRGDLFVTFNDQTLRYTGIDDMGFPLQGDEAA